VLLILIAWRRGVNNLPVFIVYPAGLTKCVYNTPPIPYLVFVLFDFFVADIAKGFKCHE